MARILVLCLLFFLLASSSSASSPSSCSSSLEKQCDHHEYENEHEQIVNVHAENDNAKNIVSEDVSRTQNTISHSSNRDKNKSKQLVEQADKLIKAEKTDASGNFIQWRSVILAVFPSFFASTSPSPSSSFASTLSSLSLSSSASAALSLALWRVGNRLTWGWAVTVDQRQAERCWEMSASLGHEGAKAIRMWLELTNSTSPPPSSDDARLLHGPDAPPSLERAFAIMSTYYKNTKDIDALFYLGWFYRKGVGVTVDYSMANAAFAKGAKRKHAPCINRLGHAIVRGEGRAQNDQQGFDYFLESAALGHVDSHMLAASFMEKNIDAVPDSEVESVHRQIDFHYEEAMRLGDLRAVKAVKRRKEKRAAGGGRTAGGRDKTEKMKPEQEEKEKLRQNHKNSKKV